MRSRPRRASSIRLETSRRERNLIALPAICPAPTEEPIMPTNLNDPLRSPDDPYRTNRADDRTRRATQLDNELQPDPELQEGPASSSRIALFAVAIALVLGAVFYGLNNSSVNHAR